MSLVMKRKSVREFKDIPVSDNKIKALLKAGMQAPSANNQQPWNFIVINERETLDKLSTMSKGSWPLETATLAIVPVIIPTTKSPRMAVQDISAATQNILLEVVHQDLGAVWIGVTPLEERIALVKETLHIGDEYTPFCIIALGVPTKKSDITERYDPSRVHYNEWKK